MNLVDPANHIMITLVQHRKAGAKTKRINVSHFWVMKRQQHTKILLVSFGGSEIQP